MGASEEFFQKMLVQMAQQNQQNKWSSPSNILSAGQLLLSGLGGLSQGAAASAASQSAAEQLAYQQAQDAYLRRLQGRTGLQNAIMGQLDRRDQAGVNIANASPLGAEQLFRQQMAGARAASAMAENFQPLMPGASSSLTPYVARTPNVVSAYASPDYRSTISSGATEDSIRDRRAVIDGLRADRPDALSRENQLMQLLVAQMQEASKPLYQTDPTGQPAAAAQPKKERGFWSKLGSVALPIAGLAAGFIPGVGPLAGAALAGAGSALGRAAGGGGVKDAILAGAGGAAAGYGMAKAGIGEPGGFLGRGLPKAGFEGPNLANFGMLPGNATLSGGVGAAPSIPFQTLQTPGIVSTLSQGNMPTRPVRTGGGPVRSLQIPPSQFGLNPANAVDLSGADFSGFDAETQALLERNRRAPTPHSSFEAAKVGGLPPMLETPAQKAAFAIPMGAAVGSGLLGAGGIGAPAVDRIGQTFRNGWTAMNTSPAMRAAQTATQATQKVGPEAVRDTSWAAQAASRAGSAVQTSPRTIDMGRDTARLADIIRGGSATGSRASSGGFRSPARPPLTPNSLQVFGPKGPPAAPTMTPQGEAFVQQMLNAYQKQLASGNQAAAQQTLTELQPFLKVLLRGY